MFHSSPFAIYNIIYNIQINERQKHLLTLIDDDDSVQP